MYLRNITTNMWSETQRLLAADGAPGDEFGVAVVVHNYTIVVGAYHDDNEKGTDAGQECYRNTTAILNPVSV